MNIFVFTTYFILLTHIHLHSIQTHLVIKSHSKYEDIIIKNQETGLISKRVEDLTKQKTDCDQVLITNIVH